MPNSLFSFLSTVIPSQRLAIYCALGSLLWIGALLLPEFTVAAGLYLLVLAFVALLDLVLSPQPHEFEVERRVAEKMNLGVANKVVLEVRSRSARMPESPYLFTLRDEPPNEWPVALPDGETQHNPNAAGRRLPPIARLTTPILPRQTAMSEYSIIPTRRGEWHFGALSGRYATRLGFWHRQFRRETGQAVRVYPDSSDVRRYELLLHQNRLRELGLHTAKLRGGGTEFESLREYTSGDNYKDINWKASARRGKLIATQFEIERDQTVLIALDCGRMMTALATERDTEKVRMESGNGDSPASHPQPPVSLSKLDCAINATVLLAHVSASMGDAVGVLLFADTVLGYVPPRKGRMQIGTIIDALYAVQPALVEPDYVGAYNYLIGRKMRRALVVTFTDVIDPDASRELLQASGILRKHHNALCVTVNNRDVMDLAQKMPQDAADLYSKAMAQRMLSQRAAGLEELRRRGVGILDVEASQLTIATVNRYLDLKSRMAL